MPMTRQSSLKTIRVGRVLTMATGLRTRQCARCTGGTVRRGAACLSIRGQSTPTPTTTARTWAFSPNRPRQARPSAFELGPFGAYGWRGGAGASRGIVYGWLTGAGCVLRGADPSHRVKLGFVFLTCVTQRLLRSVGVPMLRAHFPRVPRRGVGEPTKRDWSDQGGTQPAEDRQAAVGANRRQRHRGHGRTGRGVR